MQRHQTQRSHSTATDEALPRHGEGNPDLQDELLLMEMTILRAFQAHQKMKQGTKAKIVNALRARQ
jgi:hypothetical protein